MKKIECIIQSKKLTDLEQALRAAGVPGMTVSEVKGFGNEQTRPDSYLFLPKTKVEIYCTDAASDDLVNTILRICGTGQLGDGKVAVYNIEEVVRIRTGEKGEAAV
ncbi:MAG: hypothetical protein A3C47_01955 [Omnitrophica bacterium RIFCSPHIGHO2_02_FULL_51_18]|nr:MAG: hypothetical protein A3C47_01955 [Omnitrophica bacterium RIFCSPHIGHO2_02_FULL_51_18]